EDPGLGRFSAIDGEVMGASSGPMEPSCINNDVDASFLIGFKHILGRPTKGGTSGTSQRNQSQRNAGRVHDSEGVPVQETTCHSAEVVLETVREHFVGLLARD